MIATACVLSTSWNTDCNKPLNIWILVFSCRFLFVIPLYIYRYRMNILGRQDIVEDSTKILNWIYIVSFLWFIVGQSWIYGVSGDCRSSELYIYCLVVVCFCYLGALFPVIIFICICLCTPCLLVLFQFLGAESPQGASTRDINSLTTRRYDTAEVEEEEDNTCGICLETFEQNSQVRDLPCRHYFHNECIDPWLRIKRTCPKCRNDIREQVEDSRQNSDR
eukprot:UN05005